MLTDGQRTTGPDPLEAAKMAAERGVKVYTVGIGTKAGKDAALQAFAAKLAPEVDKHLLAIKALDKSPADDVTKPTN